jgi:tetratricopeptide (TPR) repeat protein
VAEGEVRAFESELELTIELLEAQPVTPGSSSYPLPLLKRIGQLVPRTFPTFVLESSYLRAEFVPALGGRLLKLRDRRLGVELLHGDGPLTATEDPRLGARLDAGLQFSVSPGLTSLGPVQAQLDLEGGEIWFGELDPHGRRLSHHVRVTLSPDRAALVYEVRLLNRGFAPLDLQPHFQWPTEHFWKSGAQNKFWIGESLIARGLDASWSGVTSNSAPHHLVRLPIASTLHGRVSESFSVEFLPGAGLGEVVAVSESVAVGFDQEALLVSAFEVVPQAKLILLNADGRTLETVANLLPERPLRFPFAEIGGAPQGLVIRDAAGLEILQFHNHGQAILHVEDGLLGQLSVDSPAQTLDISELSLAQLELLQHHLQYRHLVAAKRSQLAFQRGDFAEAGLRAEQELLYNGDDTLAWIEKAVAARLDVSDSELEIADNGELANAHFLAPLEPLLRAEAFFRMPTVEGVGPSHFLEPLRSFHDEMVEIACFLLERGLFVDAGRWLDEALRLAPCPMAAYLMAYCYKVASRMDIQAAELVGRAAAMPESGPYPWRPIEVQALKTLVEAFSGDPRLRLFLEMAMQSQTPA